MSECVWVCVCRARERDLKRHRQTDEKKKKKGRRKKERKKEEKKKRGGGGGGRREKEKKKKGQEKTHTIKQPYRKNENKKRLTPVET